MNARAIRLSLVALLSFTLIIAAAAACGDGSTADPTSSPQPTTPNATRTPFSTPTPVTSVTSPPARDLLDLARRFRGYDGPATARETPFNHAVGDTVEFQLLDLDNVQPYPVTATVRRVTDHAYFFVDNDVSYSESALDEITADFESVVWPTVTGAFGEPETPGVDGDPRITILNANLRGAGGYVSASDSYPATAVPRSNEREMLYIEAGALSTPGDAYNALVAHELQHLIHQAADLNEESWVNEGLSEVAWEMTGGGTDGVWEYLGRPDIPLLFWPYQEDVGVHYASAELFWRYVLTHYGGLDSAREILKIPEDSAAGADRYLAGFQTSFDDVFADFVVANYLDLPGDGPYSHIEFDGRTSSADEVEAGDDGEDTVSQFGTDYLRITGPGTFEFDGEEQVSIGVPDPGGAYWWSGRGDGINTRLTREFDLSRVDSATLTFDTWYDIEPGWDYAYVAASSDGGETWRTLTGEHTTGYNPIAAAYGPGYTGDSDGWVSERVDLTPYAGEKILLRFEYITDDATNLTGFAVTNIAIDAIGLADPPGAPAGWRAEGFQRVTGTMPQEFIVQVINDGGSVERITLDSSNRASIQLAAPATIAVSGATRGTDEPAPYRWSLR